MPDSAAGRIRKCNRRLTTIEQWHRFARPKRDIQWKDGRSAKENARAWIDAAPRLPRDIAQTIDACPDIGPLRQWSAEPEARVPIDTFRGEQPNIDLLVVAEDDRGPVVIAIEAKTDETFWQVLDHRYSLAQDARMKTPGSKQVARIEGLLERFALDVREPPVRQMRYQLLTATAAVLEEAKRRSSRRAVLIAHEFVTALTYREKVERNAADLDHFLATALDWQGHLAPGDVAGPVHVEGEPTLYVGKARTRVQPTTSQ